MGRSYFNVFVMKVEVVLEYFIDWRLRRIMHAISNAPLDDHFLDE